MYCFKVYFIKRTILEINVPFSTLLTLNVFWVEKRHEVVGEVVEVGSDVTKFRVGETVGVGAIVGCCGNCRPCNGDTEQYCNKKIWSYNDVYSDGKPTQGGFAGAMVVDQK